MALESLYKLSAIFSAVDRLTGPVRQMTSTVMGLEKTVQRAKGVAEFGQRIGIGGAMVTEAASKGRSAMTSLIGPASSVEDALTWLGLSTTSTMGGVERSLEATKKAAIDWSKVHADSAADFLTASAIIAGAGHNDVAAIEGTRSALRLAKATMGEVTEAADIMATAYGNFGDRQRPIAAEMDRLSDVMAKTQQMFQFKNMQQLTEGLKYATPAALAAGASFEEVNAILGQLNNAGMQGGMAGTAYAATMRELIDASGQLGFAIARTEDGGISLIGTIENMRKKFGDFTKMTDTQKLAFQKAFGDEGMRAIMLLGNKVGDLKKAMGELEDATGAAAEGQAAMERTASQRWKNVLNNINAVKITLGDKLAPVIDKVLPAIINGAEWLGAWVEANPGLAQAVVITGAIATGLMMIVAPLLTVISGFFILTGYGGMGLAKTAAGILWLWKAIQSGKIITFLLSVGGGLYRVGRFAWGLIQIGSMLTLMLVKLAQLGLAAAARALFAVIPAVWGFTVALLANPITWIILAVVALGGAIYACVKYWDDIKVAATGAWSWIVSVFQGGLAFIQTGINDALSWVNNMAATFFNSGAALWDAFTGGIRSALSGPAEAVMQGLQRVRNLLPFSDAREGPLSQLTKSGQALMATLAEGVQFEAPNLQAAVAGGINIDDIFDALDRGPKNGGSGAGGGTHYHFHGDIVIKPNRMDKPEDLAASLKRLAVEIGGGDDE